MEKKSPNDIKFFGRWVDITEELPPEKGRYLVNFRTNNGLWWMHRKKWDGDRFLANDDYFITHWLHLPEPIKPPYGEKYYV
jgi:hypothetical protein